jgi:hypothetical protein
MHRKSGFNPLHLWELHGNGNMEECEDCHTRFFRDYKVRRAVPRSRDHFTGRRCALCTGRLLEWTIDFGQGLPRDMLDSGVAAARRADVLIALGSSLTVRPACQLVEMVGRNRNADLVIVNLQKTPLDHLCSLRIFAETDAVMVGLMERLGIEIPPWRLHRRILAYLTGPSSVVLQGVDPFQPQLPATLFHAVSAPNRDPVTVEPMEVMTSVVPSAADTSVPVCLTWFSHYNEPSYTLQLDRAALRACRKGEGMYVDLSYDPFSRAWTEERTERAAIQIPQQSATMPRQWVSVNQEFDEALATVIRTSKDLAKTASSLSVMRKVIVNATTKGQAADEEAAKYRRVRLSNARIKAAITDVQGAMDLMQSTGFVLEEFVDDGETYLVYPKAAEPKPWLPQALKQMEEYARKQW